MEIVLNQDKNKEKIMKKEKIELLLVKGVKYCKNCGNEMVNNVENCDVCGKDDFIVGELAEKIGGYLKMVKDRNLKKYAKQIGIGVRDLTNKKVLWKLLCRDGHFLNDDKESFSIIEKIIWRRV